MSVRKDHQLRACAWDYAAQREDEVAAAAGDLVSLLDTADQDWYKVKVHGGAGAYRKIKALIPTYTSAVAGVSVSKTAWQ